MADVVDEEEDEKVVNIRVGQNVDWYGEMIECVDNLPPDERAAFDNWDRERPEGVATSDWPGFAKHLRAAPWETIQ